jgi:hypothetical protein
MGLLELDNANYWLHTCCQALYYIGTNESHQSASAEAPRSQAFQPQGCEPQSWLVGAYLLCGRAFIPFGQDRHTSTGAPANRSPLRGHSRVMESTA